MGNSGNTGNKRYWGTAGLSVAVLAGVAAVLPAAGLPAAAASQKAPVQGPRPVLASTAADGTPANGGSDQAEISGNGRFVVFASDASNLVPGDTNGLADIFVKDLRTGAVERVNVADDGTQADAISVAPSISADGRFAVFASYADGLAPGNAPGDIDVFLRDRATGRTVTVAAAAQGPDISADGRFVAFQSARDDLVPGDTNDWTDVFVLDRARGTTRRVSVADDGGQTHGSSVAPAMSADGRRIAFRTMWMLTPPPEVSRGDRAASGPTTRFYYVRDTRTGRTHPGAVGLDGYDAWPVGTFGLSPDGRYTVFSAEADDVVEGDANGKADVFARDLATGATRLVSAAGDGTQGDGDSAAGGDVGAGGRRVFFVSGAGNLVPGDTNGTDDIFVKDLRTGAVRRLNVGADGTQGTTGAAGVTADTAGRTAAFLHGDGLVPGDTNGHRDVYVTRLR